MKLNRRSVLGAIGVVGVGTGAAFGSGAFTSTTAERAVEVNVFGGIDNNGLTEDINGDGSSQSDLASDIRGNFVDVLVDTSPDTVSVTDGQNSVDGTNLFPQFDSNFNDYDSFSALNENYVSLVANDVTIVFGEADGLPPNSSVNYADLFAFVPNDTDNFDVEFTDEVAAGADPFLTEPKGTVFSGDVFDQKAADVSTQTGTDTAEALNIIITESQS